MGAGWFGAGWLGAGWNEGLGAGWTGAPGGAGSSVFAMRADRPLAANALTSSNLTAKFTERGWDPDLVALTIVPQFLTAVVGGKTWDQVVAVPPTLPKPSAITQAMIDDLLELAVTERPEALGEIMQEHENFQVIFLHLLNISHASHPQTFLLMKLAARVGELAMIYLKRLTRDGIRNRPRPSQICPTLYPPVPVPGHASYPAGHAVIAWLTVKCLEDIPQLAATSYQESLDMLADRVGFNRVIAGLHFREDVTVGKGVGIKLHDFIAACAIYKDVLKEAKKEWA